MKYLPLLLIILLFSCTTTYIPQPVVFLPDVVYTFDKLPAVFECAGVPWMGEDKNTFDGRVIDNNGADVAGIELMPLDQIAGTTTTQAVLGKERYYRGTVKSVLSPGEYTVQVEHKLLGRQDTKSMKLIVFKSGLTAESDKIVHNSIGYLAFFGKQMYVSTAVPTSGLKIKPEQFRTYIYTNDDQQKPPYNGYTIASENGVFLSCKDKSVTIRITWIQPYTNQEIDLFPATKLDIRQDRPRINTMDKQDNVTQSGNRVRVTARNIKIAPPPDGNIVTSVADVEVKAGNAQIESRLQGLVEVSSEPVIEKDGDTYSVSFDLMVNLPKGTDMINGTVKVPVRAFASNQCAGVQSDWEEKTVTISFKYEEQNGDRGDYPQQESLLKELKKVLKPFIEVRPGTVSIYRVFDISDIRRAINSREEKKVGIKLDESVFSSIDSVTRIIIEAGVLGGASSTDIQTDIVNTGRPIPDTKIFETLFSFYKKKMTVEAENTIVNAYLVTTRPKKKNEPEKVFALVILSDSWLGGKKEQHKVIYTKDELKKFNLDSSFPSNNFYDLMINYLGKNNYESITK